MIRKRSESYSAFHSLACGRVALSGPGRPLPGRYRVRPSRKREGEADTGVYASGYPMEQR